MITREVQSWLDENEILDKHIFGTLADADRTRLQRLMNDHPELLEELELSQMIIAGIRQHGRREMKRRLRIGLESVNAPAASSSFFVYLRVAAAVMVLLGSSYLVYELFLNNTPAAPVAQDELKKEDTVATVPKAEKSDSEINSQTFAAKKSAGKPAFDQKPALAAAPAETIVTVHNQKFRVEAAMIPKANEIKILLTLEAGKKEMDSKLLFKNPIDLTAVNIKETQGEQNGTLTWFYVFYENHILNVYLDNSKYLNDFKNATLTESLSVLTLQTSRASYVVDLTAKDKFKKAVLKP